LLVNLNYGPLVFLNFIIIKNYILNAYSYLKIFIFDRPKI